MKKLVDHIPFWRSYPNVVNFECLSISSLSFGNVFAFENII
jgi:hypothetical protein